MSVMFFGILIYSVNNENVSMKRNGAKERFPHPTRNSWTTFLKFLPFENRVCVFKSFCIHVAHISSPHLLFPIVSFNGVATSWV